MSDLKSFNKTLGDYFRKIRIKNGLTQENLADRSGISRATIASLESGRQTMSIYHMTLLATALDLPDLDSLYEFCRSTSSKSSIGVISHSRLTKEQEIQTRAFMSEFGDQWGEECRE